MFERQELKNNLITRLKNRKREFAMKSVHLSYFSLAAETDLRIGPNVYRVHEESHLVVIDEVPGAYWTHPVRYELHALGTGEVRVINEKYPLANQAFYSQLEILHTPVEQEF
jgi:hypothetical protein